MSMMTSQILQFMDFTVTEKSKYAENETSCFPEIKKIIKYIRRATLLQKILL